MMTSRSRWGWYKARNPAAEKGCSEEGYSHSLGMSEGKEEAQGRGETLGTQAPKEGFTSEGGGAKA